jgi:hypothetical protein
MLGNPQGSISPFVAVRFVRSKNENARFVFESAPDKISAQPQKIGNLSDGVVAFNELERRWALVGCELLRVRFHLVLATNDLQLHSPCALAPISRATGHTIRRLNIFPSLLPTALGALSSAARRSVPVRG